MTSSPAPEPLTEEELFKHIDAMKLGDAALTAALKLAVRVQGERDAFQTQVATLLSNLQAARTSANEHKESCLEMAVDLGLCKARAEKAEAALAVVTAERDELKKLVYVPGQWRCAKCKYVGMYMVFSETTGNVGVKAEAKTEACPNGCGPLWPVTERQAGNELCDRMDAVVSRATTAEQALTTAIAERDAAIEQRRQFALNYEQVGNDFIKARERKRRAEQALAELRERMGRDAVARHLYETDHAGMENCWDWDDSGLDDEHPGARGRFYRYADAILSLMDGEKA